MPGIDFTDDPLLQGRNFSYPDTQLKRLGGPNFAQLPVNASPALSILRRGPDRFAGRKIGVLVTNGADAEVLAALRAAASAEQAITEIIAPAVGGVDASDGTRVRAAQQIDGAPSVLYDAVAILASADGARALADRPAARDFVTDAVAHCKFIGYTRGATVLFEAAGLPAETADLDAGFVGLADHPAAEFVARCRPLRFWDRQRVPVS